MREELFVLILTDIRKNIYYLYLDPDLKLVRLLAIP